MEVPPKVGLGVSGLNVSESSNGFGCSMGGCEMGSVGAVVGCAGFSGEAGGFVDGVFFDVKFEQS